MCDLTNMAMVDCKVYTSCDFVVDGVMPCQEFTN